MSMAITILLIAGAILVYSAVKGKDPRDVVKGAIRRG